MSTKQVTCRSVRGATGAGNGRPLHFPSVAPNPAPGGRCTAAPPPRKLRLERILEKLLSCSRSGLSARSSRCARSRAPGVRMAVCWGRDPGDASAGACGLEGRASQSSAGRWGPGWGWGPWNLEFSWKRIFGEREAKWSFTNGDTTQE